ncbi:hypothetical protein AALF85_10620 [Jeotgalicoccus halotolerans]|uniref:hypothetical protein n=1 Tax=Jeotgalicoccus halotolerans TaxID=157227 RepID=UPI003511C882
MQQIESKIGMRIIEIIFLVLLGIPRTILHDLSLIEEGTFINLLFVFVPILVWIVYILFRNDKAPAFSIFILCVLYGVILAVTHQLLWAHSFPGYIQLGGNLSELSGALSTFIARSFAFISSLMTGALTGLVLSMIIWVLSKMKKLYIRG